MDLPWLYLYDGETQALSMKMGAVATPHIFIFDQERKKPSSAACRIYHAGRGAFEGGPI